MNTVKAVTREKEYPIEMIENIMDCLGLIHVQDAIKLLDKQRRKRK